ncbi:MAG TPA: GNAT family N-acetyltransferase [Terriglobia bacterium]|nr:GNAT family N-acetyltransferase [Terriglobia bacterium]
MKYVIRSCRTRDELAGCVKLQRTIWGYAKDEVYPLRLFVNLQKIGGMVVGAFAPGGELVGFVTGMPAWHGKRRYIHSLSLGVAAGHENRGLGQRLKLEQRRRVLDAGIDCIEWTFDPMRAKNAFLNLVRLGAIARRYTPDYYGPVKSRLQQGLPSDRLICEWWLKSPGVKRAVQGKPARDLSAKPVAEVEIPAEMKSWAEDHPRQAQAAQSKVRARLMGLFRKGLVITGFSIDGATGRYLLDRAVDLNLPVSVGAAQAKRPVSAKFSKRMP